MTLTKSKKLLERALAFIQTIAETRPAAVFQVGDTANWLLLNDIRANLKLNRVTAKTAPVAADFTRVTR